MEKNNMIEHFEESDKECWEKPDRYALIKEELNGVVYYSIFLLEPVLMMKLCDDFDYALRLSMKMIENGVRVFEDFKSLSDWYHQTKSRS
jgi:hypothetical protein